MNKSCARATTWLALVAIGGCPLCTAQATLTVVAAADYNYLVAPNSIVSMYAANIATGVFVASDESPAVLPINLGGVSATITDASGHTAPIPLIAVTEGQVNAVLPTGLSTGGPDGTFASITLTASNGSQVTGKFTLAAVAPSLFTADESGGWLAAAQVVIAHANGSQTFIPSIATCTSTLVWNGMTWSGCVPIPINLGSSTDTAVLELFGTGIRGATSIAQDGYQAVTVTVGPAYNETYLTVLYAGPQAAGAPGSFYGLDQVNVVLPQWLAGSGTISLTVTTLAGFINDVGAGADSNTVYVNIQ